MTNYKKWFIIGAYLTQEDMAMMNAMAHNAIIARTAIIISSDIIGLSLIIDGGNISDRKVL